MPEVLLWQRLRRGAAGAKFRRQHPLGAYVADFYCSEARLVIEVDGGMHEQVPRAARDFRRDAFLRENGFKVIRIAAGDVLRDPDAVASAVAHAVRPLHHRPVAGGPPPRAGEE